MPASHDDFAHIRAAHSRPPTTESGGMNKTINANRKAICAVLAPLISFAATSAGLHWSVDACAGIAAGLTGVAVWAIPNRSYGKSVATPSTSKGTLTS